MIHKILKEYFLLITIPSVELNLNHFGILSGIISTYFAYRQYKNSIKEKKSQRILNKSFGSELFGKETIMQSTYCYVEPNCTNIDPTVEAEPKNFCMVKGNMFSILDDYLLQELPKDNAIHHIFILADSGMGKTSFLLNYYAYNQKKSKRKRQRIALVPLGMPETDEYIRKIENKNDTIIFLDAFDEDIKAIKNHRARLTYLMKKCSLFKRVVITCRTQFFQSDKEIPKETGIIKVANRKAGEPGFYTFNKIYISPLSDNQVGIYLKNRFKWNMKKRKKGKLLIEKVPNLKVRPMLLANIPELINSKIEINFSFQIYEIMVENWLKREKGWIKEEYLRKFSEKLAFNLYLNRGKRLVEKIPKDELSVLADEWSIKLENWQLTGRSLLNRDAEGYYKFAHRSIMEFFFVVHFFNMEINDRPIIEWTDQQSNFALEAIKIYLKNINLERANFKNSKSLPEWIENGLDKNKSYYKKLLMKNIQMGLKNLRGAELRGAELKGADLTGTDLSGADLTGADLKGTDLSKANLSKVNLSGANLCGANLSGANLSGVDFERIDIKDINLEKANFNDSKYLPEWIENGLDKKKTYYKKILISNIQMGFKNLRGANLMGADLKGANLNGADLSETNLSIANLEGAYLNKANLSNSNLSGANLYEAKLRKSNIEGANIERANITGIDLRGASFDADIRNALGLFYSKSMI